MHIGTQVASDGIDLKRGTKQLCRCREHALGTRHGTVRKATLAISDFEEWEILVSDCA